MAGKNGNSGGEKLQILILTLFMTAGGFALICLVFYFFIISGDQRDFRVQAQDHNELVKLLDPKSKNQSYVLRRAILEAKKNQGSQTLTEQVENNLGALASFRVSMPQPREKKVGNSVEYTQTINFKDARLQDLFNFVARVKSANASIQMGALDLTRATRSRSKTTTAEDDRWSANLTFVLYSSSSGNR